ncbi:MAG: peptide/nickel transport system substrate-binding protein [Candidatus Latescibacterota bacterium]|jgi:peptide/nickel transport system substrate-binding protein
MIYATAKRWGSLLTTLFLLPIFFLGCLATDPGDVAMGKQATSNAVVTKTRAAKQIDPIVLKNRIFGEAPMLAEKVKRGELPPVSERLPENPLIVVPVDTIGQYGGTIRRALTGDIIQTAGVSKTLGEDLMGFSRPLPDSIEFNLAENYEYQDDGKTAIFKLRKGIKWSDGHPYTVDDILFWYYDMTLNDDARNSVLAPSVWFVGKDPIQMEKVDDHTLKVKSQAPLGRILHALSGGSSAQPKHIFSQWHPKYNPQSTYQAFRDSSTDAQQIMKPGIPRLSAWVPVEWIRGQRIVYERNPYYHKIDTAGNQLPYADRITFTIIQDPQVILLKFINAEIDLFGRYSKVSMFPTLKSEEKKGRFKLRITGPDRGPSFYINWDTPKTNVREAFRNLQVRIALSHAINREEINQIVYHSLLDPAGYSFNPSNPYYTEESYRKYSAYDPEKSKAILDKAGYRDTDGDSWRELKDGSRFEFNIDVTPGEGVDVSELVSEHWRAIGIKANLNISLRDIIWPRRLNGEFDIHQWGQEGPADPLGRLNDWAIMAPTVPFWHRNASEDGPEWLHEATRLIKQTLITVDQKKVREQMSQVRDLHTDNVPVITVGSSYSVWGAGTRLGNVPFQGTGADVYRGWSRPVFHEQIYIKQPISPTLQ